MAGFTWAQYESDTGPGGNYGRKIDDYYLGQLNGSSVQIMGAIATSGLDPMPHLLTPRHVVGVASSGQTARAVCFTTGAPLWVGTSTTWTGKSKSGATITYTVTGWVGERRTIANNPS